jgi:hypothetical protein
MSIQIVAKHTNKLIDLHRQETASYTLPESVKEPGRFNRDKQKGKKK